MHDWKTYSDQYFLIVANRTLQNLNHSELSLLNRSYGLNIPIPKFIFNEGYPVDPRTFGEKLRKTRMDTGLLIIEFAALIGVTEDTVINWELRGMRPHRREVKKKINLFFKN